MHPSTSRPSGIESLRLRVRLALATLFVRRRPERATLSHLSDHERRDIGLPSASPTDHALRSPHPWAADLPFLQH